MCDWAVDRDPGIVLGNLLPALPPFLILPMGLFSSHHAVVNTIRTLTDKPIRYRLSIPFVR